MTVATELVTIRSPVQAANRLCRAAAETLQSTLPPLLDELPAAVQLLLAQLETWSNDALRPQLYVIVDEDRLATL